MTGRRSIDGVMLIEAVVYLSLVFIVACGASMVALRLADKSERLKEKTDLIARVLQVGEVWRREIREAKAAIVFVEQNGFLDLHIPTDGDDIVYRDFGDSVWRSGAEDEGPSLLFSNVERSEMIRDQRGEVVSWRWELQLSSERDVARVKPHFTFQAVRGFRQ